jgi:hypothetical protein
MNEPSGEPRRHLSPPLQRVFARLREVLLAHQAGFSVSHDTAGRYGLEARVGPATVRAWGGKIKMERIPIAWVEVRKSYVGYHLIGLDGNAKLIASLSAPLRAQMQGKTCFHFNTVDETLLLELRRVTADSLRGLGKAGFISDEPRA